MKQFVARAAFAVLVSVVAVPAHAQDSALIGTSEDLEDHEGHSEQLEDHEGASEQLEDHVGRSRSADETTVESETISEHEATSETLDGRIAGSESLEGVGAPSPSNLDSLDEARAKLRAARASHAHHEQAASATVGSGSAASEISEGDYAEWTSRIDVAQKQIDVARASAAVWDESYADMLRNNYPRGDERQRLIDSREQAHAHVAAEEARLPEIVEEARRAGVPPGVLDVHTGQ